MNAHILRRSSDGRAGKRVKVGDVSSIVVVVKSVGIVPSRYNLPGVSMSRNGTVDRLCAFLQPT